MDVKRNPQSDNATHNQTNTTHTAFHDQSEEKVMIVLMLQKDVQVKLYIQKWIILATSCACRGSHRSVKRRGPTARSGGGDPTDRSGGGDPTARSGGGDPTARSGGGGPTARLGGGGPVRQMWQQFPNPSTVQGFLVVRHLGVAGGRVLGYRR